MGLKSSQQHSAKAAADESLCNTVMYILKADRSSEQQSAQAATCVMHCNTEAKQEGTPILLLEKTDNPVSG